MLSVASVGFMFSQRRLQVLGFYDQRCRALQRSMAQER